MTTTIIIRKIPTGFTVIRNKTKGTEKGDVTLATLCGGLLGRVLTIQLARTASTMNMADVIVYEDDTGTHHQGEDQILDLMSQGEVA